MPGDLPPVGGSTAPETPPWADGDPPMADLPLLGVRVVIHGKVIQHSSAIPGQVLVEVVTRDGYRWYQWVWADELDAGKEPNNE